MKETIKKIGTLRNIIYYHLKRTSIPVNRIAGVELTNRCNQQCSFCPVNTKNVTKPVTRKQIDMDIWEFTSILEEYNKYMRDVNISHHGECFLHPNFDEAILALKKYKIAYSITTNGSLVGEHIDILEEYPPGLIMFSLYTLNPDKFKTLTKTGDVDIVLQNVEKLLKLKKEGRINTRILIRAIKMDGFEEDVEKVKDYFLNKDVDLNISVLNSWAGRVDITKYGTHLEHTIDFKYCIQPWLHCIIGSNSGVYICNNHEDEPIEYLYNKSLEEIWNSNSYRDIRKNILNSEFRNNKICSECDSFISGCMMSKPSAWFFMDGVFLRYVWSGLKGKKLEDTSGQLAEFKAGTEKK